MKYTYRIQGLSNGGKPKINFHCEHCRQSDFHLPGSLYSAQLEHDPRVDIDSAAKEFVIRLNSGDTTLFEKRSTYRKVANALCNCDPDIIDLEHRRAVRRARIILERGLSSIRTPRPDSED